jgi:hypothetical protein
VADASSVPHSILSRAFIISPRTTHHSSRSPHRNEGFETAVPFVHFHDDPTVKPLRWAEQTFENFSNAGS